MVKINQRLVEMGTNSGPHSQWRFVAHRVRLVEWTLSRGFRPRFGLFHLDRSTQTRTKKPVADVYARIIRKNSIGEDLMKRYGRAN